MDKCEEISYFDQDIEVYENTIKAWNKVKAGQIDDWLKDTET